MPQYDKADVERRMKGAVEALKSDLQGLRTGRANTTLLDPVQVEVYGSMMPLQQVHGDIVSIGLRIGNVAYCCDVSNFPEETVAKLSGLDLLYIDALQYRPHPSHLSLEQALGWIKRLAPKHAVLTHMHTPLDYETVMGETPPHVEPGYDQFIMEFEVDI